MSWLTDLVTKLFERVASFFAAFFLGVNHEKNEELKREVKDVKKENEHLANQPHTDDDVVARLHHWQDLADD